MTKRTLAITLALAAMLLLAGCAGIRPAVPPPGGEEEPKQEEAGQPAESEAPADTAAAAPAQEAPAPKEEEEGEEPAAPSDEIEVPAEAMPGSGARELEPADVSAAEAEPAEKGPEPVALEEGYRVQVATTRDRGQAERIAADLRGKVEADVHNRYDEGRYTLLAGVFEERADAVPLRDSLRTRGYAAAYIVQTRVPAGRPEGETGSRRASGEAVQDSAKKSERAAALARPSVRLVDGFRVQILSLSDRVRAEQVARGLRHETGYNGYVEADGESYRIRAGDFMTREKAEEAKRRLAEEYGYDGAYVVATKIIAR